MSKITFDNKSTALPFDQPSDFHYRRAVKYLDKDDYKKAVINIRKAIEKDSSNVEYILELAGILSDIEHFDDSNELLFMLLQEYDKTITECYYGIGYNFFWLNDHKKASSCLLKYLKLDPDGVFVENASIMLENIENDVYIEDPTAVWRNFLYEGNSKKAINILSNLSEISLIDYVFIKNNLTVAYLLESQLKEAEECCNKVLSIEPNNVQAICNMSLIQKRLGNIEEAKEYVEKVMKQQEVDKNKEHDINNLLKISVALCELDMHEEASKLFSIILKIHPYDTHALHFSAISLFNTGQYEKALKNLNTIAIFKPKDSINNWYIKLVKDTIAGTSDINYLPYENQVSTECIYKRINKINDIIENNLIQNPWENSEFRELVLWAFNIKDDKLKSSMITLITKYAGNEASKILFSKLCSRYVSDGIKHKILIKLKEINAKEPYVAILDGSIVEINVNTFEVSNDKHINYQKEIIELLLENCLMLYEQDFLSHVIEVWNNIISNEKVFDNKVSCQLWASILEYEYILYKNIDTDPKVIAEKYLIDQQTLVEVTKIIMNMQRKDNGNISD
jgi:tetratricopeptide (TPR) repeat protein